jgi:hypothetical protein
VKFSTVEKFKTLDGIFICPVFPYS